MARKIEVEILGDSRSLERAFLRSSKAGSSFASGISKAGLVAGAAVAGFAAAAVKGVQAASNLEEQVNKSNVVFEQNAGEIRAWSKTTADAFGLSQRAALEFAGGFGQMLQTAGVLPKQSAEMSKALVELGSDLASFNNIDPTEALEKLRSGLSGEAEPLRRLGVFLSEARVQQEAYRQGIAETGEELTEAQKVQARYALILQDTAKAQGDFSRTSDSLANSQRRVRAQLEDAAAGLSRNVLPLVADAADAFASFIDDFSKARTVEAKLDVVVSGLQTIGSDIFNAIRDAVDGIDWPKAVESVADGIQGALEDIAAEVGSFDWRIVGRELGRSIETGLLEAADVLEKTDWGEVGAAIVRGIENFILGIDWKAVAIAAFKLLRAAFLAPQRLVFGAGKEIGAQLVDGIGRGIAAAKDYVLRQLLEFVNDVLGVTSFLGRFDPFRGLRESVQRRLDQMAGDADRTAKSIQGSLDGIKDRKVTVAIETVVTGEGPGAGESARVGGERRAASAAAQKITGSIDALVNAYRTAAQNAIERGRQQIEDAKKRFPELIAAMELNLDRAGATEGIRDDLRELRRLEDAIREEMRIEGETVELARQLFDVRQKRAALLERSASDAADRAREAFAGAVEGIEFRIDEALEAGNFAKALRANVDLQRTIRARIREEGKTVDLLGQLDDALDQAAEIRKDMRERERAQTQREQFRALGLTGEGEKPTPTIANLQKQLGSLEENVKGTILDTPKTQALFERVRKVLAGQWGKATEETREKIREFFAEIRGELRDGERKGDLTPTMSLDTSKIVSGLGLDANTIRELRGRLAGFNTAGVALAGGTVRGTTSTVGTPFTVGPQSFAFDVYLDGEPVAASVIPRIQKRSNRNPGTARGRFAGRSGI